MQLCDTILGAVSFTVSLKGFLHIAEAVKGSDHPPLPLHKADLNRITSRSIRELAAYAARQPLWRVEEVEVEEVDCSTSTDGQALVGLLQQCENWVVRKLRLTGTVDKHFWQGLALAIPIGPIPQYWRDEASVLQMIRMNRKVMARGRPDHLRKVWRFTGGSSGYWWVNGNCEPIRRRTIFGHGVEREEEGWKEIVSELEKEVTVEVNPIFQTEIHLISGHCVSVVKGTLRGGRCQQLLRRWWGVFVRGKDTFAGGSGWRKQLG